VARRQGDAYLVNGTKMFVTNGREGNTFALLALTDPQARPRHRGMSCFIVETGHPGLRVAQSIAKLGYKGVDTAELVFEDCPVPAANLVGGQEGRGFKHVMSGLETGRINIAARAVGVGQAAMDATLHHLRASPGPPPGALADMAARLAAARRLTYWAAGMKDRAERCDLEAGMAKLGASETAQWLTTEALRVHGETATLAASAIERLYRDTPLMIIGEGTNEIQRTLVARQLLERHGERLGALTSRDDLPAERRQMVLAVRQFVEKDIAPVAAELERAARFPAALVAALAELGVLGALVPPAWGGLGLDLPTYAMLVEELARGCSTVAAVVAGHVTATAAIARFGGTPRERWLPGMTRGETLGSVALAGRVTARRERTDCILRGESALVDAAARAGVFVVQAAVEETRTACLLVPRGTPGLTVGQIETTLGAPGREPARLVLDDARVPASAVLGEGEDAGLWVGGLARLGLAATAVGVGQAAFEAALRYSQQRTAFGVPICQHQAIQLKLADMATAVTGARLLTYEAAEHLEDGDDRAAALARLHAGQAALEVTLEAMRVHGGYGYTADFPVERYYRDAPRLLLALGDPAAERQSLARRLLEG
jgi:alkylation response protein AidB-like acyl-CoA dehydrogenase